jgi:hydrogenase maturation protease
MSATRILVAGIGNVFLGDDGFGVEVVRRLGERPLPTGVRVVDFGIRGIDLTYALLENYERVILVDTIQRGGEPGSLYLVEPGTLPPGEAMQTHEMAPAKALAAARMLGPVTAQVLLVGCEPESFGTEEDPRMGLSARIAAAVDGAVALVESLAAGARDAAVAGGAG